MLLLLLLLLLLSSDCGQTFFPTPR